MKKMSPREFDQCTNIMKFNSFHGTDYDRWGQYAKHAQQNFEYEELTYESYLRWYELMNSPVMKLLRDEK